MWSYETDGDRLDIAGPAPCSVHFESRITAVALDGDHIAVATGCKLRIFDLTSPMPHMVLFRHTAKHPIKTLALTDTTVTFNGHVCAR